MNKMLEVMEGTYENLHLRQTCVPLFISNPGIGKTSLAKQFAASKGVAIRDVIASQMMPNELTGMAMPNKRKKLMEYFDYELFAGLKDGDIVFFDELLQANPMVLNAALTVIGGRELISGRKIPKVMIIAAANYQNAQVISPQVKERFIYYDTTYDSNMWFKYMEKYKVPIDLLLSLEKQIKKEAFKSSRFNYITPRSVEKAIEMMIAGVPTPYEAILPTIGTFTVKNETDQTIQITPEIDFLPQEIRTWLSIKQEIFKHKNK